MERFAQFFVYFMVCRIIEETFTRIYKRHLAKQWAEKRGLDSAFTIKDFMDWI